MISLFCPAGSQTQPFVGGSDPNVAAFVGPVVGIGVIVLLVIIVVSVQISNDRYYTAFKARVNKAMKDAGDIAAAREQAAAPEADPADVKLE